jgi:hypothetical protein
LSILWGCFPPVACDGLESGDNAHSSMEMSRCGLVMFVAFENGFGTMEHMLDSSVDGALIFQVWQVEAHFTKAHNVRFILIHCFESVLVFFMLANAGNPLDWTAIALT